MRIAATAASHALPRGRFSHDPSLFIVRQYAPVPAAALPCRSASARGGDLARDPEDLIPGEVLDLESRRPQPGITP